MTASQKKDQTVEGRSHDPMAGLLFYELRRTAAAVAGAMAQEFAGIDLNASEAMLLVYVGKNAGCTQSDIKTVYGMKATNLVPLIARLEGMGLLVRVPGGRRTMALTLSKAGVIMLAKVEPCFRRIEKGISHQFTRSDHATLIENLRRVAKDACGNTSDTRHS